MTGLAVAMPDIPSVVQALFVADMPPGVTVGSDLEENTVDDLPFLMHAVDVGGRSSNWFGVWPFTLTVTGLGLSDSAARKVVADAYAVVRSWAVTRPAGAAGGVRFESVSLLPARVDGRSRAVIGKQIEQHTGTFQMTFFERPHFHSVS